MLTLIKTFGEKALTVTALTILTHLLVVVLRYLPALQVQVYPLAISTQVACSGQVEVAHVAKRWNAKLK